jgi:hypothetical protein
VGVAVAEQTYFRTHHAYTTDLQKLGDSLKPPGEPMNWATYHVEPVLKDEGKTYCVQSTSDVSGKTYHYDLGTGMVVEGSC